MEQNVARSRTFREVLWWEVRFFFRVFSRVFLRHPFLHIREGSLVFSFLVCPPLLFSPLYSLFSPPLLLPSLSPFPPFPLRRKHNHKHNHKHHHTTNTEPPTYKIPLHPPYISSHQPPQNNPPILPPYTSKNKKYTTAAESIPRNIQVYPNQPPTCSLSTSPRKV